MVIAIEFRIELFSYSGDTNTSGCLPADHLRFDEVQPHFIFIVFAVAIFLANICRFEFFDVDDF